jgi:hypothetical protein
MFDVGILLSLHFIEIVMFSHGSTPVFRLFSFVGFAGRDNPDYGFIFPITVTYNEDTKCKAYSKHQKTVLIFRVVRIKVANSILIEKNCLRLLE